MIVAKRSLFGMLNNQLTAFIRCANALANNNLMHERLPSPYRWSILILRKLLRELIVSMAAIEVSNSLIRSQFMGFEGNDKNVCSNPFDNAKCDDNLLVQATFFPNENEILQG